MSESSERNPAQVLKAKLEAQEREDLPISVSLSRSDIGLIVHELEMMARRIELENLDAGIYPDEPANEMQTRIARLLAKLWPALE